MTNGDRIRARTDEELAEWGSTLPCCPPGPGLAELCFPEIGGREGNPVLCRECWLKWLKQEAGE